MQKNLIKLFSEKTPDKQFILSGDRKLILDKPLVMGILNVTPDSFFGGSRVNSENEVLQQAKKMLNDGADILDIGGYSSRPGAKDISEEEELSRVISAIRIISENFPDAILSVDTFRGKVAREAVAAGASIINDISAGNIDPEMIPAVIDLNVPYVLMHMRGTPQTMQQYSEYTNITEELSEWFISEIKKLGDSGITDIIIDPGFGFSKKPQHNFQLLNELEKITALGFPVLAGLSRKSFIYKTLDTSPENALTGTIAMNTIALMKGSKILRVHDVKEAKETILLFNKIAEQEK